MKALLERLGWVQIYMQYCEPGHAPPDAKLRDIAWEQWGEAKAIAEALPEPQPAGCACPAEAEKTCCGQFCPRLPGSEILRRITALMAPRDA